MSGKSVSGHREEVAAGRRFPFGKNWKSFLARLDDDRIGEACRSLQELLGVASLEGKSFLDVGSGSGLSSLAAMRLGAQETLSFDYDPDSVACTREVRRRYFPGDERWRILEGSVLDKEFLSSMGRFDIVYSWGVLHHTGAMWRAIENTLPLVKPAGLLAIAIYNDQGWKSLAWRGIKRLYCRVPRVLRPAIFLPAFLFYELKGMATGGGGLFASWRGCGPRGMSRLHDWIDWMGGYPFEVARPEEVSAYLGDRGFHAVKYVACKGSGNNEFVFRSPAG
jgi:2-polyprenyl-6-hydroxyphenyl methylase/3-demethylubiquinone-9 3-methyltransferase